MPYKHINVMVHVIDLKHKSFKDITERIRSVV